MVEPNLSTAPAFPRLLSLPLRRLPTGFNSTALTVLLNRMFARALDEGELDFLQGKVLRIEVRDAGLRFALTVQDGALRAARAWRRADACIEGSLYDFLLLAARREDPDTLFFNRRLRLNGDTELGLYVKNFLDAFEPEGWQEPLLRAMDHTVDLAERWVRGRPAGSAGPAGGPPG
ncbi:MAG: sterol-binding protein [Gammaproteobacteria bacterium]|nr:sterol-binding protein [Gammaproteobacteria bacterium]NIR97617.1 sterol-binding protein [Gammaproteobacteria bacterium]NIT63267.1 sterol-binding protein [Gammaproteobacteria bacterium]NIV20199.1 sterol-binding protein [Gammaproteobacteria bacterium]NIY31847.1 sterol-binding protein [Gammaproteobacteria bacterium]